MVNNADLHCHSTVSDGLLAPAVLASRALNNGVDLWALTDHDETSGVVEAAAAAAAVGLRFVAGVEISVSWADDLTVHILGLGIDVHDATLQQGLIQVREGRDRRAHSMAEELRQVGIDNAYAGALKFASNPALVSRSHFARYIVERGFAKEVSAVFDHWLAKGKPGYVAHAWATMSDAVRWISCAGGMAVVAHPGRYRMSKKELRAMLAAFKDMGGAGIEVVSGAQNQEQIREGAALARQFGFFASRGSDFHGPGESWVDLGRAPALPEGLTPVWSQF